MKRIEIGSIVRVRSDYHTESLVGHAGTVVAYHKNYADPEVLVQFEGMDDLHEGNGLTDRQLDRKSNKWWINPKYLEVVEKVMTKKDLKSGMTVKLRNGDVYLVIDGFIAGVDMFVHFKNYKDDLSSVSKFAGYDIMEAYQYDNDVYNDGSQRLSVLLNINEPNMKLLWKREEKKLTDREVEVLKALKTIGYKYIARDSGGALYTYFNKPIKKPFNMWADDDEHSFPIKKNTLTLDFIKWEDEEPYNIEELLKGEKQDE